MDSKAVALLAVSMCLIATAGIGAVSASVATLCRVTLSKINPDGTTTVTKTFEDDGPIAVTVIKNDDGSINITKEDRELSEEELNVPNVYREITITPETKLPAWVKYPHIKPITICYRPEGRIPCDKLPLHGPHALR